MNFRKEQEESFALDMTPLIDVVFLLLIFFMVSTAFVDFPRKMDIDLPTSKVASEEEKEEKNLEIEMTSKKEIFLNGKKVSVRELEEAVKDAKSDKALIRADKSLPYGKVIEVMGLLRSASINNISVAVK